MIYISYELYSYKNIYLRNINKISVPKRPQRTFDLKNKSIGRAVSGEDEQRSARPKEHIITRTFVLCDPMPELVLKHKITTPAKGNSYIVHSDGFVYEVVAKHLSKYYRNEGKYKALIQKLVDKGKKITKKKVNIEKGYLYYVTGAGVCRAKLP